MLSCVWRGRLCSVVCDLVVQLMGRRRWWWFFCASDCEVILLWQMSVKVKEEVNLVWIFVGQKNGFRFFVFFCFGDVVCANGPCECIADVRAYEFEDWQFESFMVMGSPGGFIFTLRTGPLVRRQPLTLFALSFLTIRCYWILHSGPLTDGVVQFLTPLFPLIPTVF